MLHKIGNITVRPELTIPEFYSKANLIVNQFRRENETWQRTLEFLIDEDIILKGRISDILKNMNQTDEGILKRMEHFHNRLLKENDSVRLLRTEVADMEKHLNQNYFVEADSLNNMKNHQRDLRKDLETAESEFQKLKSEFNSYIDKIL